MSNIDNLKKVLENFFKNNNKVETINLIRKYLPLIIKNDENLSLLEDKIPDSRRSYRELMWRILLSIGKISLEEFDPFISEFIKFDKETKNNLVKEARRIKESQESLKSVDPNSISTDFESCCSFLILFSGFLKLNGSVHSLDQPLLTFGPLFLQYFTYPIAFYAFKQFVINFAPQCYPIKKGNSEYRSNPAKLAVQIAYLFQPTLEEKLKNKFPEVSISYSHVLSFFTQMRELHQVSLLFDFIFAYGAFFIVFFEAAWLCQNPNYTDLEKRSLPNAQLIIKKSIDILNFVLENYPEKFNEINKFFNKNI